MADYAKQNFVNGQVLTAECLNRMEKGIEQACRTCSDLTTEGTAADAAAVGARFAALESGGGGSGGGGTGTGIQSVIQTTTSTEDDGINVITVTLTDGTISTFRVENGSKGSTPQKGQDYYTEADKAEMVSAVIAALPDASEVSY